MTRIKKLTKTLINKKIAEDVNRLLPQLSSHPRILTTRDLKRILKNSVIFAVFDKKHIVGIAMIHFWEILLKKKGFIDDVVIDKSYRGRGLGKQLTLALLTEAKKRKIQCIDLSSEPERKTANIMYRKLGFQKKKTNYYRLLLK